MPEVVWAYRIEDNVMARNKPFQLSQRHIERALDQLAEEHGVVASALSQVGYPAARRRPQGFESLARIVIGQQVSTKAAAAIAERVYQALSQQWQAEALMAVPDAELRAAGLSGQKLGYLRELATAVLTDQLPVDRLAQLDDTEVQARITAIKGFGDWSAHMYLMFSLGRPDIWPVGDLAVRAGFGRLMAWQDRPTPGQTALGGEAFAPYRSALALLCWKFYSEAPL